MKKNILHLYQYAPLVEAPDDKELDEKEWHRRLKTKLQQTFWLSPLSSMNDPFERNFKIHSDLNDEEYLRHCFDTIKRQNDPNITWEKFNRMLASPVFRLTLTSINQQLKDRLFTNHGVACFSRDPISLLMWAHYANKHRGYCTILEIDFTLLCREMKIPSSHIENYYDDLLSGKEVVLFNADNGYFVLTKVRYSSSPPVICFGESNALRHKSYSGVKYLAQNIFGVKYDKWSYEEEFRIVSNLNSLSSGNISFNLPSFIKVTGIIMGDQVTDTEKQIFHRLCRESKVALYQARCWATAYKILTEMVGNYSLSEYHTIK